MKYTKKQQQEIEYLKTWAKTLVSEQDIEEYILVTTKGIGNSGKFSSNPLIIAQQRLGITLDMWKEDMVKGLIGFNELIDDASCEYEKKLIISLRDSVTGNYRKDNLKQGGTVLSFTNFPKVMDTLTK